MILSQFVLGILHTNCYTVSGESFAFVVDPAIYSQDLENFAKQNKDKKYKYILLTHCHFDHIGGVESLKKIFGGRIVISKNDAVGLSDPDINLSAIMAREKISITPDITISEGDVLETGEEPIKVIETPGHTSGGVCYLFSDMMFSGDTLFCGVIGRTDLPTSDIAAMMSSLKKLYFSDKDYRVLCGHGKTTQLSFEKETNEMLRRASL